jgi:shikimate dehydrogenase
MRRFGLIGYPLSHSFSRKYFKEKFRSEGLDDCSYQLFPIQEITELPFILEQLPELEGINVTIPHKISVMQFLTSVDDTAGAAGAVNTIKISRQEGKTLLSGYNTDVYGFERSLKPLLQPHHRKALILGTGGASKAVAYVLKRTGIDYLHVSRNPQGEGQVSYSELNEAAVRHFPLIINTTPLGMFPDMDSCPPIPYEHLSPGNFLFDLVYNPEETLFLEQGRAKGCIVQNGLPMLHLQAEKAWEIWNS